MYLRFFGSPGDVCAEICFVGCFILGKANITVNSKDAFLGCLMRYRRIKDCNGMDKFIDKLFKLLFGSLIAGLIILKPIAVSN